MWLSILYYLCDYTGIADCLSYEAKGRAPVLSRCHSQALFKCRAKNTLAGKTGIVTDIFFMDSFVFFNRYCAVAIRVFTIY